MLEVLIYIAFLFTLLVSFFILYLLSKNDFVLVRQNVSLTEIFNITISGAILSGIMSRVFYVFDTNSWSLFNPLIFFHIIKVPGLSIFGFYITMAFWVYLRLKKQKALPRISDIISLSFSLVFLFSLLIPYARVPLYFVQIGLFVAGLILVSILFRVNKAYKLKDGSITFLVFFLVSLQNFILAILFGKNLSLSPTFYLSFIIMILSLGFFNHNQRIIFSKKKS